MLFFYIRHGDPIYQPDSLTPLGERQAEAVGKRLAVHGLDKVYTSTSKRAILTAKPTCEILRLPHEELAFAHEKRAAEYFFTIDAQGDRQWVFTEKKYVDLFHSSEVQALGHEWYRHPAFADKNFSTGVQYFYDQMDAFFADLGYEHERYRGRYKITRPNNDRVALFAHQGFGMVFLSTLLDLPYPTVSTHFDFCHTGMTVIDFQEYDGYAIPKILMHSSDGHLYREGLPLKYNYHTYI
jgi:probable phosphoglycerate mutase